MSASKQPGRQSDLYPIFKFLGALKEAQGDPRVTVLVAHGLIELFTNAVVDAKCRNGKRITEDSRGYPHSIKLVILNELGLLSDRQFTLYDWFRKLRNRAAHDALFEVSASDLSRFDEKFRNPSALPKICDILVLGFWNMNVEVLAPAFMVGLKGYFEARKVASTARRPKKRGPSPPLPDAELLGAVKPPVLSRRRGSAAKTTG